jgi:hypothetical protein
VGWADFSVVAPVYRSSRAAKGLKRGYEIIEYRESETGQEGQEGLTNRSLRVNLKADVKAKRGRP